MTYTVCVFADISKAFDTVSVELLCNKLSKYGIRGNAQDLLRSFLSNRSQFVDLRQSSMSMDIFLKNMKMGKCGAPQGSKLALLLFSIYTNNIFSVFNECEILAFADELAFYFYGHDLNKVVEQVNKSMSKYYDYCNY